MAKSEQRFHFFRAGGFDQLRLEEGAEIVALDQVDQKLWVALACPTQGLELDPKTLAIIDSDHDGRIRPPEVLAAVEYAGRVLKNPNDLRRRASKLALSAIDSEDDEGKRLLASAKQILRNLGKKGEKEITLEETLDTAKIFAQTHFNGDGVVPAESADDLEVAQAIKDIIASVGSVDDRSGKPGVSAEKLDAFFTDAKSFDEWWTNAEAAQKDVLPLGDRTAAAADAVSAVRAKVDDYFVRCRLAAFDARAAAPLNPTEQEYAGLHGRDLSTKSDALATFPIARIEPGRALPLDQGVNPVWAEALAKLRIDAVAPLLGDRTTLAETDWIATCAKLAAYDAWSASKPATTLDALGPPRVRELLRGESREKIDELIARDRALEPEANAIASVEKLLRYSRDLHTLLCNFVSFRDFYSGAGAIFQAGTLYLDGRSCELCIRVTDVDAHASVATLANTFLVYCHCSRVEGEGAKQTMTVAAALTSGVSSRIRPGRNGLFYDMQGRDWDAAVVKVIEHPISVRQAFWLPYQHIARFAGEQIEKFAASREKHVHESTTGHVKEVADKANQAADGAEPEPSAARAGFDVAKFAGIFAAIGLAIGAIGSTLALVFTGFLGLRWWQMPLAMAALILVVSGPSMLIAYFKLRQRNLGPILDAAGWAVNADARINIPFGASLTHLAALPAGAERALRDPYAEKHRGWILWVVLALALAFGVAWELGYVKPWLAKIAPRPQPSTIPEPSGSASPR